MTNRTEPPSIALKGFVHAAVPLVAEILDGLGAPARAAMDAAIADGSIISTSLRVDVDLVSQQPTVVLELVDRHGRKHPVETRNVLLSPPPTA